jgi:hypothetical protein
MRVATKITFLVCLVGITLVPIGMWVVDSSRDLSTVAGFVGAAAAPMGVLTGAMAANSVAKKRNAAQTSNHNDTGR